MNKKLLSFSNKHLLPLFTVSLFVNMMVAPDIRADDSPPLPPLPDTEVWTQSEWPILLYRPEVDERIDQPSDSSSSDAPEIFYPTNGQSPYGLCWMGLTIDSNDNVYPIGSGQIYKILPDGTLVNGVNDANFFASGGNSYYATLDEAGGYFYTAGYSDIRRTLFSEGSTFSSLIPGIDGGEGIALGQGSLTGSLFATESGANRVSRITLSPLGLSTFADGTSFFNRPESIASAPDGTLYVVNIGSNPAMLTKVTPTGVSSTFATGNHPQENRAVVVDNVGNVYWSAKKGINKYDASGLFLGTLPGPPDKVAYENPMGAAFDSKGNLYIVDNFNCKGIYKYKLAIPGTCQGLLCTIQGTDGDDSPLVGTDGDDVICGGKGNDTIIGAQGDDVICGGKGNDTLIGNEGYDIIEGEDGDDFLEGDKDVDVLQGGYGNDIIQGDLGNDFLFGGLGQDSLDGAGGANLLNGGTDTDLCEPTAKPNILIQCNP